MNLIYKQALNIYDQTELFLPKGAKFLFIKSQSNTPMIWYEFDPDVKETKRRLLRIQIDNKIFHSNQTYIGTFEIKMFGKDEEDMSMIEMAKMKEFSFVGHVYEEILK